MLGAIVGDIVGSVYEFHNTKKKNFRLFTPKSRFTDDTVMTLAVAKWLTEDKAHSKEGIIRRMQDLGRHYPLAGYGQRFFRWLYEQEPRPYNSFGNGSAMRVSPVAFYAHSLDEALELAETSAEVTHNHPEGIRGAQAVAASIYLARVGRSKEEIRDYVENNFHYDLSLRLDDIRPAYSYNISCQGSVPQALLAFLEGEGFENVIRLAVSLGGDSDTIAAMAGGVAQAYYGVPKSLSAYCYGMLTPDLREILNHFEELTGSREQDPFYLDRFVEAQDSAAGYRLALGEMRQGKKSSHWIWYIFPQLRGLGHSSYAQYYGLADIEEAQAYLAHPVLGERLKEITTVLLSHVGKDIREVMVSGVDALKLRSSMTLFNAVCPSAVFGAVLDTFYQGHLDGKTLERIEGKKR